MNCEVRIKLKASYVIQNINCNFTLVNGIAKLSK